MPVQQTQNSTTYRHGFVTLGLQYYFAGRASARMSHLPVCGHLMHHSIEMFLKAHLATSQDAGALKKLGHSLANLWPLVRDRDAVLGGFDNTVAQLDEFESIRYPDKVIANGANITVEFKRAAGTASVPTPNRYVLVVNEIDELVIELLDRLRLDATLLGLFTLPALQVVVDDNPHAERWREWANRHGNATMAAAALLLR